MDFSLDSPDAPVNGGFRHPQFHSDLYAGMVFHAEIEHRQLVRGEVAHSAEPLTFRLGKFGPNVHLRFFLRRIYLTLVPLDRPSRLRRTITRAIKNTPSVFALNVVCGTLRGINNNRLKLAPLVDVVDVGSRQGDHQDADHNQKE